jgi:hypothetical protein
MKIILIVVCLSFVFLTSCVTYSSVLNPRKDAPQLSYSGDSKAVTYIDGKEIITSQKKLTSIAVNVFHLGKSIVIDIAIKNNDGRFNFDPLTDMSLIYTDMENNILQAKEFTTEEIVSDVYKEANSVAQRQRMAASIQQSGNAIQQQGNSRQTYAVQNSQGRNIGTVTSNNNVQAQANIQNYNAVSDAVTESKINQSNATYSNYAANIYQRLLKKSTMINNQLLEGSVVFEAETPIKVEVTDQRGNRSWESRPRQIKEYRLEIKANGESHIFIFKNIKKIK